MPAAVGLKVTLMVHEPSGPRFEPQVLVCEKSPLTCIPLNLTAALPWLVTFRILARLVAPTFWAPNFTLAGTTDNAPGVAVEVGVEEAVAVAVRVAVAVAPVVCVAVIVAVLLTVATGLRTGVGVALAAAVGVALAGRAFAPARN